MRLSEHFDSEEFRCVGRTTPGHPAHRVLVDRHLVAHLEDLRAIVGRPLRIVTGHRCVWWEVYRGRSGTSQHVRGRAADIPSGYATVSQAESAGFVGIGRSGPWAVHVDVRTGPPARWRY